MTIKSSKINKVIEIDQSYQLGMRGLSYFYAIKYLEI